MLVCGLDFGRIYWRTAKPWNLPALWDAGIKKIGGLSMEDDEEMTATTQRKTTEAVSFKFGG